MLREKCTAKYYRHLKVDAWIDNILVRFITTCVVSVLRYRDHTLIVLGIDCDQREIWSLVGPELMAEYQDCAGTPCVWEARSMVPETTLYG